MKSKITLMVALLVILAGCRVQKTAKTTEKTQSQTEITQEKQTLINSDLQTAAHAISASDVDVEIDESEVNIKLSAPDSVGNQYPVEITLKGKKSGIKARNRQENSVDSNAQVKTDARTNYKTTEQSETVAEKSEVSTRKSFPASGYVYLIIAAIIVAAAAFVYFKYLK
jgi:hypothetical protein